MQKSYVNTNQRRRHDNHPQIHRKSAQMPFYPDITIARTIGHMQEFSKGLNCRDNAAEMEFLQSLLSQYGIKIVPEFFRCENLHCGENTSGENANSEDLDAINNVTATDFAYLRNARLGRVLLYTERIGGNFSHPISFECNGVILDSTTWKPLVLPSAMFNPVTDFKSIEENLHNYKIYPIFDGTLVNFYYYDAGMPSEPSAAKNFVFEKGTSLPAKNFVFEKGTKFPSKWCMGSKHGYDVSEYKWIGNKTYLEAFKSALGAVTYEEFVGALSPDCCYSVLFRCHEFHPLLNDPQQVQLVRIADLNTMEEVSNTDPRYLRVSKLIAEQKPYEDGLLFCDLYHLGGETNGKSEQSAQNTHSTQSAQTAQSIQPEQSGQVGQANPANIIHADDTLRRKINKQKFKSLITRNQTALDGYLRSIPAPKKGAGTVFKTHAPHIHYGYILRDSRWHSASHVMLESTLLKQIRQYIYNLPAQTKQGAANQLKITEANRLNYSILRAYLSPFAQKEQFLRLFPQFIPIYGYYDDIMMKITKRVIKQFKGHGGTKFANESTKIANSTKGANGTKVVNGTKLTGAKNDKLAEDNPAATADSKKIEVISRELYKHISSREKINPFDKNSVSLVRNYIEHSGNIKFLFVALHGQ